MKNILITGANSYIGTSVEKRLMKEPDKYNVDTLDMQNSDWKEYDFSKYDVVFHVAGIAHIKETRENSHLYFEINRDLALETAKKAKASGIKQFIYLSSMSVYGLDVGTIGNDTKPNPISSYGKSKFEAEELLKDLDDENFMVCILRPPMVYGENSPGNLTKLINMVKKIHIFPTLRNRRSAISVEMLSMYIEDCIDNDKSGLILPQDKEYMCTYEIIRKYMDANNIKVIYTSIFNPILRFLIGKIGLISKCFGDLIYE